MNLNDYCNNKINNISNKNDFSEFLLVLYQDYIDNNKDWENQTLKSYLESLYEFSFSIENVYENLGKDIKETNTWQVVANILLGAAFHE